jgi:hypothetical protein
MHFMLPRNSSAFWLNATFLFHQPDFKIFKYIFINVPPILIIVKMCDLCVIRCSGHRRLEIHFWSLR